MTRAFSLRPIWLAFWLLLVFCGTIRSDAQISAVPNSLNFQGRIATPSGNPVPDGTYSIRFSLWDAVTAGTEKYNKTIATVAVKNGTFAVTLDAFPAGTFNSNLYLEVKIGGDTPLTPRTPLASVPYAMKSDLALTVPDGSITGAKLAPNAVGSLAWLLGGNSGTDPAAHFLGTVDNQPLVFKTNRTERLRLTTNGNFGIGTAAPLDLLSVGNLMATGVAALDQQMTTPYDVIFGGSFIWQSFTPAVSGLLTRLEVALDTPIADTPSSGLLTVLSGEGTGGTVLYSQPVTIQPYVDIAYQPFSVSVPVVANQTYTFQFSGFSFNHSWAPMNSTDKYGRGRADWGARYDYLFKTYVTPTANGATMIVRNGVGVGIHTTNPTAALDVNGTVALTGFKLSTGAGANKILTSDASGIGTWQMLPNYLLSGATAGGDLFGTYPNPSLRYQENSLEPVSGGDMFASGGSIGIGRNPSGFAMLDIARPSASDGRSLLRLLGGGGSQAGSQVTIDLSNYTPSGSNLATSRIAATDDGSLSSHLDFYTKVPGNQGNALSPRLRIGSNGNIGIGTQTPNQKLSVFGTIESVIGGFKFPDGTTQTTAANGTAGGDLTGTYPNPTIGAGKVDSTKLADNAVTTVKLASGAVTTAKLAANSVDSTILADNAVLSAKISVNAVTSAKLANDGAGLAKVSDGAISASGVHVTVSGNATAFKVISHDDVIVGSDGAAGGSLLNGVLRFGGTGSGEGIGSKRTSTGNQFGLDFYTASGSRMSITSTGNVGIGTTAPAAPLEIRNGGNLTSLQFLPGTLFGVGQPNAVTLDIPGATGTLGIWDNLSVNGNIVYTGTLTHSSDARYKTNIATLNNALDDILNLRGVSYNWDKETFPAKNFTDGRQIGFIAQELERIFPELVSTDSKGYKSVNYIGVVPVLVEAVKAQNKKVETLSKENAELKARLERIEAALAELKANK